MIGKMAESAPADPRGFVAAKESLRGSAKWIASGAAVAAGGIFAGSSLTNLGSLDPYRDGARLALAFVTMEASLFCLGILLVRAIGVLAIESVSIPGLAAAERSTARRDREMRKLAKTLIGLHEKAFPTKCKVRTIAGFFEHATSLPPGSDDDYAYAEDFSRLLKEHGSFLLVRDRFGKLASLVPWLALVAALAVFPFLWAANPPERPSAPDDRIVSITVSQPD